MTQRAEQWLARRLSAIRPGDTSAVAHSAGLVSSAYVTESRRSRETPQDQPWGHRTLFFRDPDGNVLEIYAEI